MTKERVDLALILAVQDGNFQSDASKALDVLQQLSSVAANIYDISIIDILPYDDVTVDVILTSFLPSNIFYKEIWPDTDDTQSTSSDYNSPYSANSNVPTVFIIVITVLVTCFCMLLMYALFVFKKKAVTRYAELNSESSPMHTHNKEFSTGDLSITVNSSHGRTSDDNGIEMASVGANSSQKDYFELTCAQAGAIDVQSSILVLKSGMRITMMMMTMMILLRKLSLPLESLP